MSFIYELGKEKRGWTTTDTTTTKTKKSGNHAA